jgi:steroid delta-isomerase
MSAGKGLRPAPADAALPTPEQLRATCLQYLAAVSSNDPGSAAELFAIDGTLEDPVGRPAYVGRDRVREFFARNAADVQLRLTGPLIVCGLEVAMTLEADVVYEGANSCVDVIDVVEFDTQGAIRRLRAFVVPVFKAR